ncbi:hypothetical protein [Janthinobacterium sp. BJB401]|uniref:hypothetical protein n=1 Tax=Janthinobacterium sp. BJB401 TaxID=2745934 RepID=UPI001595EA83|nr:hypothetical protein [Janthinobacterium sp. BJB401]NVI83520.1 hypothetical protein [Janthinobacterium sp. BJB401]
MSNVVGAVGPGHGNVVSPAGRALREADDGIGGWLAELVTGAGSSPSHIIVTGILGVIPGVGQAMDARDLILGVIQISRYPAAVGGWVELVITLVGCVPVVGDSLKVGFKLMKQGSHFGRVLEAVSPTLRGNVEKFMRKIDWGALSKDSKGLFNSAIETFIDGIDSWVVKAMAGGPEIRQLIGELKALQKQGPRMIDDAFADLKKVHAKMMGDELPHTTAALGAATGKVARQEAQDLSKIVATKEGKAVAGGDKKLLAKKNKDAKENKATPNTTKVNTKKKGEKKKSWRSGVPAEHITDYSVKNKHIAFHKANNGGVLTEEHSMPHNGLDHLWSNPLNLIQPFVVGETKSSIFDSFNLINALPCEMKEKFNALREDEAANPLKNGRPNIFDSEGRDEYADKIVNVGRSGNTGAIRGGLNKANRETKLAAQMSHAWIVNALEKENLTAQGMIIKKLIRKYEKSQASDKSCSRPYERWICLVTGRQLAQHKKSNGSKHAIQLIFNIPDNLMNR